MHRRQNGARAALYDRGVRMIALTWNYENSIGFPNSADPELHASNSPFGFEVVERMGELGMIVDVSHLSEGGFFDVAEAVKGPFAASHSCARALCGHSRNLTDRQLRVLGDHGGVCGVNFYSSFSHRDRLHSDRRYPAAHGIHRGQGRGSKPSRSVRL